MALDPRIILSGKGAMSALLEGLEAGRERKQRNRLLELQEQANAQNTELRNLQIEGQKVQNQRAISDAERDSMIIGSAQLLPFLERGDKEGAANFLATRRDNILARGGKAQDTEEMIGLLQTNPEQALNIARDNVEIGYQLGKINAPAGTKLSNFKLTSDGGIAAFNPATGAFERVESDGLEFADTTQDINVNLPGDKQPITSQNKSAAQAKLISASESMGRLQRIKENFDPAFLTFQGKISQFLNATKSKLGRELTDKEKDSVKQYRRFTQLVNFEFNAYRKEITGAAAAIAELEDLKKAMINEDLSPAEFEAAFNEYSGELSRSIRIRNKLLREGFDLGSDEFAEQMDRHFLLGEDDDHQTRGEELMSQGLSFDEAVSVLEQEGY